MGSRDRTAYRPVGGRAAVAASDGSDCEQGSLRFSGELLGLIDEIAADPAITVERRLEPAEVNSLKNSAVLPARTVFVDYAPARRKCHLVRLWLTAHGNWADGDALVPQGIPRKAGAVSDAQDIATSN